MVNIARTLVGRRREQIAAVMVLAVGAFAIFALFAVASEARGENKTVARFKWSLSGSMQHDWTLASSEPCAAVGPGRISATFKAKGKGAFKVFHNPRGYFFDYNPQVTLKGSVTETDDTHQNPNDIDSPCKPTDKSRCGTRQMESSLRVRPGLRRQRQALRVRSDRRRQRLRLRRLPDRQLQRLRSPQWALSAQVLRPAAQAGEAGAQAQGLQHHRPAQRLRAAT